jgi:soluble P-type ATPase
MITIDIPGYKVLNVKNVVMDYNGTLAVDGYLIAGVKDRIIALSKSVTIQVVTADTFGLVREQMADLPVKISIIKKDNQADQKRDFICLIGQNGTIAIGNGRNDGLMLKEAELGIMIIEGEGAAMESLKWADIVVKNINDALDLFLNTGRLIATMRK